jgi:ribosomal protein L12E/L44/L45/RPP1/RPP2
LQESQLVNNLVTLDESSIKKVLTDAGVKADDAKVTQLVKEVQGKDVLKVINHFYTASQRRFKQS